MEITQSASPGRILALFILEARFLRIKEPSQLAILVRLSSQSILCFLPCDYPNLYGNSSREPPSSSSSVVRLRLLPAVPKTRHVFSRFEGRLSTYDVSRRLTYSTLCPLILQNQQIFHSGLLLLASFQKRADIIFACEMSISYHLIWGDDRRLIQRELISSPPWLLPPQSK